jgi:hypothetical protein
VNFFLFFNLIAPILLSRFFLYFFLPRSRGEFFVELIIFFRRFPQPYPPRRPTRHAQETAGLPPPPSCQL